MSPATYPLDVYRGDSQRWQFRLWTDAGKTVPADLTGVVATADIRTIPDGPATAVLVCVVTLPNIVDVQLTATESAKLIVTPASWDLQLTYPAPLSDVRTIVAGRVQVTADVTR